MVITVCLNNGEKVVVKEVSGMKGVVSYGDLL